MIEFSDDHETFTSVIKCENNHNAILRALLLATVFQNSFQEFKLNYAIRACHKLLMQGKQPRLDH